MNSYTINNNDDWQRFNTEANENFAYLYFIDVTDTINVDELPPTVSTILLNNSPHVRFIGNQNAFPFIHTLFINQFLNSFNDTISVLQPSSLIIFCSREHNVILLKENLVIRHPLTTLKIVHCTLRPDSLHNVLQVRYLELEEIANSIIPSIPSTVTDLFVENSGTIIFSEQLPIMLKYMSIKTCELGADAYARICDLDLRRRRSNMRHLQVRFDGLSIPANAFCPDNFYSDMNNELMNTARVSFDNNISNQLDKHIRSFISGGTRKKKRGKKQKRTKSRARSSSRARRARAKGRARTRAKGRG